MGERNLARQERQTDANRENTVPRGLATCHEPPIPLPAGERDEREVNSHAAVVRFHGGVGY